MARPALYHLIGFALAALVFPLSAASGEQAPAKITRAKNHELVLPAPIVFDSGTDRPTKSSANILKLVRDYIDAHPRITSFRIEAHTDTRGSSGFNMKRSKQRAMAVADWLIDHGVACSRLVPVGFGETQPLVRRPKSQLDHAKNRRVAFYVAVIKRKPVGKGPITHGGQLAGDPCQVAQRAAY